MQRRRFVTAESPPFRISLSLYAEKRFGYDDRALMVKQYRLNVFAEYYKIIWGKYLTTHKRVNIIILYLPNYFVTFSRHLLLFKTIPPRLRQYNQILKHYSQYIALSQSSTVSVSRSGVTFFFSNVSAASSAGKRERRRYPDRTSDCARSQA